jgi:hypothetical protein
MSFGKSFAFSLLTYMGLNFLFIIISAAISNNLNSIFSVISVQPLSIILYLFGPIVYLPGTVITNIANNFSSLNIADLLTNLGYLIAPLVASLIAGNFSDNKGEAFGGWFLTAIVSMGALLVLFFIGTSVSITLIGIIIGGIVNGIFYSCFALLIYRESFY